MSRKRRIEYPGALYHVINRGDHLPAPQRSRQAGREDIFRDDEDHQSVLSTLGEACGKTDWQVHAYRLMRKGGNTTMSLKSIAQRLNMGSWIYVQPAE